MAILFLHCSSVNLPVFPGLEDMLSEIKQRKVIILPAGMAEEQPEVHCLFDAVIPIPGMFMDNAEVEMRAFSAHAEMPFTRVVFTGELGVLRAARLRQALGIPGQTVESAFAYRDKVLMKTLCAASGIRVPEFRAVDGPADLLAFVHQFELPVVLKPRSGAGSINTKLIWTDADVACAVANLHAATDTLSMGFIVEKYVSGQLYHVNGYAGPGGQVLFSWPASYIERGNLDIMLDDRCLTGEYLLDPGDWRVEPLNSFTRKCLRALPWPVDGFSFHLEAFIEDGTEEIVFCEVGCRQGGGSINDLYEFSFGANLLETSLRLQAGLGIKEHRAVPDMLAGGIQVPARKGIFILKTDAAPPFPWVLKYDIKFKSGENRVGPKSCADIGAEFVASGATADEVLGRLFEAGGWFEGHSEWLCCTNRI
jgi:hypothetical protein